jgi:hypothetical protein
VLDVEWNGESKLCPGKIPRPKALAMIRTMLEEMEAHTGKRPIIYTDITFHEDILEGELLDYPHWVRSTAAEPHHRYNDRRWTCGIHDHGSRPWDHRTRRSERVQRDRGGLVELPHARLRPSACRLPPVRRALVTIGAAVIHPPGGAERPSRITLWGRLSSINVQKVAWCLDEIGLDYVRIDAGGMHGVVDTPEYRQMNPNGLIPVIEVDGFVLWESNAIVRHLASEYGGSPLWRATGASGPTRTAGWIGRRPTLRRPSVTRSGADPDPARGPRPRRHRRRSRGRGDLFVHPG